MLIAYLLYTVFSAYSVPMANNIEPNARTTLNFSNKNKSYIST